MLLRTTGRLDKDLTFLSSTKDTDAAKFEHPQRGAQVVGSGSDASTAVFSPDKAMLGFPTNRADCWEPLQ